MNLSYSCSEAEKAVNHQRFLEGYHGDLVEGDASVLSAQHRDMTRKTAWYREGYTLLDLPGGEVQAVALTRSVTVYVRERLREEGLTLINRDDLGSYHNTPGLDDGIHIRVARWGMPLDFFEIDRQQLEAEVSRVVGRKVSMLLLPDARGEKRLAGLRGIRPGNNDHNPFHRDGWLECYQHTINLWVPLINCGLGSSLRVFAGSHLWPESDLTRTSSGAKWAGKS